MTRVSGTDHVLLLLRERLQRLDRSRGRGAGRTRGGRSPTQAPLARLQALAALDELPGEELRRTLVRAILSEELGEEVANDPSFQAVSDEVFRILSESEDGRGLIARAEAELRVRN